MSQRERLRFYEEAGEVTSYVSIEADGAMYLVRTKDLNVGRSLFVKGSRGEIPLLARAVAVVIEVAGSTAIRGRQFVDVGANIGTATIPALARHSFRTAVCIEPEPENVLNLRLNLVLNRLEDRATVLEVAASNKKGKANLVVNPEQGGQNWIAVDKRKLERRGAGDTTIHVPTVTLDQLMDEGEIGPPSKVGLVWMDAQAHEGHILEGATRLVDAGVPVVLEWDPEGLDQLGDRQKVEAIAGEHYTHFVDLRPSLDSEGPRFELRSARNLADYAEPFRREGGRRFTDILLLRLDKERVDDLDVDAVLARNGGQAQPQEAPIDTESLKQAKRALLDTLGDDVTPDDPRWRELKQSPEAQALRDAKRGRRPGTS